MKNSIELTGLPEDVEAVGLMQATPEMMPYTTVKVAGHWYWSMDYGVPDFDDEESYRIDEPDIVLWTR